MAELTEKQKKRNLKRASIQVKQKIKLEKKLLRKITAFFNKQSRLLRKRLDAGEEFDAKVTAPELKKILEKHYKVVVKKFTKPVVQEINKVLHDYDSTIEPVKNSNEKLVAALALFILNQTNKSTELITQTSNKIVTKGTVKAERDIAAGLIPASSRTNEIVDSFDRKKQGRSGTITVTETQKAAEGSKHTVAMAANDGVISNAIIYGGSIGVAVVVWIKEWFTMGDSKVRPWHVIANLQSQNVDDPYIVDNELLMYPGDITFGASPRNVCHCRCVSISRMEIG